MAIRKCHPTSQLCVEDVHSPGRFSGRLFVYLFIHCSSDLFLIMRLFVPSFLRSLVPLSPLPSFILSFMHSFLLVIPSVHRLISFICTHVHSMFHDIANEMLLHSVDSIFIPSNVLNQSQCSF